MAKERVHILVMKGNAPIGFVKSVSYVSHTFKTTPNKLDAKGYVTQDKLMGDIDAITTPETVESGITFHLS